MKRSCTIRRPPHDVYSFVRDAPNWLGVVRRPLTITTISPTESHWVVAGPPGARQVEWRAVIITEDPDRMLGWRSRDGADVPNAGSVHFVPAPGDEGTEVTVHLRFEPPANRAGAWFAKLAGKEPALQLAGTLRRLKALLETGEIPTTAGQPRGREDAGRETTEQSPAPGAEVSP